MHTFYSLSYGGRGSKLVNTMLVAWLVSFNELKEFEDAVVSIQNSLERYTQQQRSSLWDFQTATIIINFKFTFVSESLGLI